MTAAGLCAACRHGRRTANKRGSSFWLCERSKTDPRFVRYPALPVLACPGFELRSDPAGTGDRDRGG
jgi:hypothetical protein